MRKFILFSLLALSLHASADVSRADSLVEVGANEFYLQSITPAETRDYVRVDGFWSHWFLGVQGGYSSFIGKPVGCGDMFDRGCPVLNAYLGKWFTPSVGARVAFQGVKFCDSELTKQDYQLLHADLMYNMANWFRKPSDKLPHWDFSPYVGAGLAHGKDVVCDDGCKEHRMEFALTYGIQVRYRVGRNFHFTGELGCFTTFSDFDGVGSRGRFGENLMSASLGIGFTFGNPKWNHPVDANPFIAQSDYLLDYVERLEASNRALRNRYNTDTETIAELKKILKLEGLLVKYGHLFDDAKVGKSNYKGLLSLRSRLNNAGLGNVSSGFESEENPNIITVPIYFFFKLGEAVLTDNSQLINLDELAKVVNSHNLRIQVIGAADSATGNESLNDELSKKRSLFITEQLKERGVSEDRIEQRALGGISEFNAPESNRYSKVAICLELDANNF